ncbi:ATP-dependent Clp protease proteolytic subunit [Pseudobacteriovorax antillogorgiicola]|uniref:ATP-dependent Clp protease proteolytic subunit n=1 Tax=Pseudobacteriovorax antillogorgiicola TaxID=1513793 RepID=A0A1Y6B6Z7_9BACT|nr:ATP-dependent Clp protease proteolytic subunit [Pseudobacteriovorax antillogorgiicola]TCS59414.1 ATP-dependent Clp protease proteolytic subunit ClpP [Pseudobacteriovorax antillogorgiicola]SME88520.1 ATP-dependent Clp protease, protease subunit [Pseudobacteriovorax antillogorgiicola]
MEVNEVGLEQLPSFQSESKLIEKRTIFVSEGINSTVAKRVINHLLAMEAQDSSQPIYMYLNSPGGEVNSGFAIYDTMRFIKSDVRVVCTGLCASIATIMLLGAEKEHRYGMPNCKYLIHQPLIGGHVQGQASDLEITAREIIKTRKKINDLLSEECSQPFAKVEEDTTRDYWMNSDEALEYGLISKIVSKIDDLG